MTGILPLGDCRRGQRRISLHHSQPGVLRFMTAKVPLAASRPARAGRLIPRARIDNSRILKRSEEVTMGMSIPFGRFIRARQHKHGVQVTLGVSRRVGMLEALERLIGRLVVNACVQCQRIVLDGSSLVALKLGNMTKPVIRFWSRDFAHHCGL